LSLLTAFKKLRRLLAMKKEELYTRCNSLYQLLQLGFYNSPAKI